MIILLQPAMFLKMSKLSILDDENKIISTFEYNLKELAIKVPALCKEYPINKVIIAGNKKFNQKIGQQIKSNSISQYNLDIEIEYA